VFYLYWKNVLRFSFKFVYKIPMGILILGPHQCASILKMIYIITLNP